MLFFLHLNQVPIQTCTRLISAQWKPVDLQRIMTR